MNFRKEKEGEKQQKNSIIDIYRLETIGRRLA